MNKNGFTKPRIRLVARANWECADAHLARCGRNWKQAYDRWLMASLRQASQKAGLAAPPAGIAPKKRGRPRKELKPMGWWLAEQNKAAAPGDERAAPEKPELAELRKSSSSVPSVKKEAKPAPKPITIKTTPKVAPIAQPKYQESEVRQLPGTLGRREYVPPTGLRQNMERAASVQRPLISISAVDRSAS